MYWDIQRQRVVEPQRIPVSELRALLDSGADMQILDVRTDNSYRSSDVKIPGAMRISPTDIKGAAGLRRDVLTITYCT